MNRHEITEYLTSKVFSYGTFGKMMFLSNGNISLYNTFNERSWSLDFDGRSGVFKLLIFGDCKRLTATFVFSVGLMRGFFRDGDSVTLAESTFNSFPDSNTIIYQPDYEKINGLVDMMRNIVTKVSSQYSRIALLHHYPTKYTNVGDAIQYLAMRKMISDCNIHIPIRYVYRDFLNYYKPLENELLIINGCVDNDRYSTDSSDTLFIGIHGTSDKTTKCIKKSKHPVGVRDMYTKDILTKESINCYFSACPTLGFNRYNGIRKGITCGDCNINSDSYKFSHICYGLFPEEQNKIARKLLDVYESSEIVYTSKLHCALPCIAFGTPLIVKNMPFDGRTEIMKELEKK
jgi:hypothetical protein